MSLDFFNLYLHADCERVCVCVCPGVAVRAREEVSTSVKPTGFSTSVWTRFSPLENLRPPPQVLELCHL